MSKLEKDSRGFWNYKSNSGVEYSIGIESADLNIVTDWFPEFYEITDSSVVIHHKLVDYVYGDIEKDTNDIKEWLDDRIDFYEKHERTIKFLGNDNNLYKTYLGTEEHKEWNAAKEISIEEFHKMVNKPRKLNYMEANALLDRTVWCNNPFKECIPLAQEIADKLYELKTTEQYSKLIKTDLITEEDYSDAWEWGNFNLYSSMDELIEDEFENGIWDEDETLADCAKWCYDKIDKAIFKLSGNYVIYCYEQ